MSNRPIAVRIAAGGAAVCLFAAAFATFAGVAPWWHAFLFIVAGIGVAGVIVTLMVIASGI